jgi:branched-chain amino acid transport system permease protein
VQHEPTIETVTPRVRARGVADYEYALEARGINFSYLAGVTVLEDIDFVVRPATIHGLIGPNGSGKSTLVNLLSGQLSPSAGTITLNGERVERQKSSTRAGRGMTRTFQTAVMVRELSTQDNVTIGQFANYQHLTSRSLVWPLLVSGRRDSRAMRATAQRALHDVGLGSEWNTIRVADIPHGVEQLTQLAAACVGGPSVLILDEPLAGLSSGEVDQVALILRTLRDRGVTIVVVEHQTRFIFDVCDEVTVLAAGQFVRTGNANEVRLDDRVREVYLGL